MILKAISVDFWTDTLANLETLSQSTGIPKNEIIRRGTEISLLLYGLSEKEANEWLLESLRSTEKILSKRPLDAEELKSGLSKSTVLAAAASSIYITYAGREQASVLKLYFRAIQQHLLVMSEPSVKLGQLDVDSIKEDVASFANIVSKLKEISIAPLRETGISAKLSPTGKVPIFGK